MSLRTASIVLLVSACASMSPAETWPAGKVVGWRGDGSGIYPDANPPTVWYQKENGESKNILWKTKLPCYSWSTPIVVGDKIFTRSEPYDLICLNKNTGNLLWIRSHPPIVGVGAEERKSNPAFREMEPLLAELQKVNDAFVARGWTAELYKQKYDLQKKINELTKKAGEQYELPRDMYVESWSGYTASTPCSDGQRVWVSSGVGVVACYDLNGKLMWADYLEGARGGWGEHGMGMSPVLFEGLFIAPMIHNKGNLIAYDKTTGAVAWKRGYGGGGAFAAVVPFNLGGTDYLAAFANIIRLTDGKSFFVNQFADPTPVIDGGIAYYILPMGRIRWYKMDTQPNGDLKVTSLNRPNDKGDPEIRVPLPDEKDRWNPMANWYTAAPLYHDGLLYFMSNWGNLVVVDVAKAEMIYQKKLPFDFKNPQGRKSFGMGAGSSPALAGKYIYTIDSANCAIVMEPGREYKQVSKNTINYTVPEGWEQNHWTGPHQEQTEACPVPDGNRLYIRGEQFLYCIGEK